jgi:glyoxylase I family protein
MREGIVEKVKGIGGVFFRASDPIVLSLWYPENLGINLVPENYEQTSWQQQAGPTVFAPFPANTEYFGNPERQCMIDFRVTIWTP